MKNITNLLIPIAFLLLSGFSFMSQSWLEAVLYLFMGSGFTIINLLKSNVFKSNLKFWNTFSWTLVIMAALMFMVVLLNDANKEILVLQPIR